jgi:hypothetical protein
MFALINKNGITIKTFATAEEANDWQDANAENETYELAFIN